MLISDFENSQCQTFKITPLAELFVPGEAFSPLRLDLVSSQCVLFFYFFTEAKECCVGMLWNRVYAHLKFVSQNKFLCYSCRSPAFFQQCLFQMRTNLKHQIKHSKWPKTMHMWLDFIIYYVSGEVRKWFFSHHL